VALPLCASAGRRRNASAGSRRGANAGSRADARARRRKRLRYKAVPVFDDAEEDIARFFHDTNRFIGKARRARQACGTPAGAPHLVLRCSARSAPRARGR